MHTENDSRRGKNLSADASRSLKTIKTDEGEVVMVDLKIVNLRKEMKNYNKQRDAILKLTTALTFISILAKIAPPPPTMSPNTTL